MKKNIKTLTAFALFLAATAVIGTSVQAAEEKGEPTAPTPKLPLKDGDLCQVQNDFGMCSYCPGGQDDTSERGILPGTGPGTQYAAKRLFFCDNRSTAQKTWAKVEPIFKGVIKAGLEAAQSQGGGK